jgi:hypothetical protein
LRVYTSPVGPPGVYFYSSETEADETVVLRYSDTLLIFLLKGAAPQKYREREAVALQPP